MNNNDLDQMCIDIYLKYHVSQLKDLSPSDKKYWELGQKKYTERQNLFTQK